MHGSDFNYNLEKKNTVTRNAFKLGSFLVMRMGAIIKWRDFKNQKDNEQYQYHNKQQTNNGFRNTKK